MLTAYPFSESSAFAPEFAENYRRDEAACVAALIKEAEIPQALLPDIRVTAAELIKNVRQKRVQRGGLDAFLKQYDLSSDEGVVLMCLAEALLRIPDADTANKFIASKMAEGDWATHLGQSKFLFVNASTWGLMITGKILTNAKAQHHYFINVFNKLIEKQGAPLIRLAMKEGMRILGNQFVLGETIEKGLKRARENEARGFCYSYDMLGEEACTDQDAAHYLKLYTHAIDTIGKSERLQGVYRGPGISVKLSALLPQYQFSKIEICFKRLLPRIQQLCLLAKSYDIGLTIDAEESERLQISLALFEALALDPKLKDWNGLGLAVQAYQKRAPCVLDFLITLAQRAKKRLMVRLVKGAYWDGEIKRCQENGLEGYPVFTRKVYSDVSYLACAKKMLAHTDLLYPMFATHNAYTFAAILKLAGNYRDYEFQCLHGMGETLYDLVVDKNNPDALPCRIYAPCGGHEYLLAYLVRRLLENGANTSFVKLIIDETMPLEELLQDPVAVAEALHGTPHPRIPLPRQLYGVRMNSKGMDLTNTQVLEKLAQELAAFSKATYQAHPLIAAQRTQASAPALPVVNPARHQEIIGHVVQADAIDVDLALTQAVQAFKIWHKTSAETRANLLEHFADLLEQNMAQFMFLAIKEAGKSVSNAVGEVREAVDFCRYYAQQARIHFGQPMQLPGPTGETNQLSLHGRGVVVCISPWNFPLAIFLGEVTAALAAGNVVIAKPAEQTPLIAYTAIQLMHTAGFPKDVLQFLPGTGETVGAQLTQDPRVAGVIFTGANATAQAISQALAHKPGPLAFLIAETGGQNALVVDSSALPEQVVKDVIASAFDSAGQRCSALRVLYLQKDIADKVIQMLKGAMDELQIGDPLWLSTDVGPVIDDAAREQLLAHIKKFSAEHKLLHQTPLPADALQGTFVAPTLFEIPSIQALQHEVFGPVLHIIRFDGNNLENVVDEINSTGFGLTCGIHSRIPETIRYLETHIHAGNIYVNRNIIGAVVGVQPFGGQGLSGTGPKAGGPYYLPRLAIERVITVNTTAAGGNASLMSLAEDPVAITQN
jgi:RHH-type proline utilization regulon transcriptional repressor/proline dehydrogenase/delta 1-pyrroline-5-carboxylate dehydrogenase